MKTNGDDAERCLHVSKRFSYWKNVLLIEFQIVADKIRTRRMADAMRTIPISAQTAYAVVMPGSPLHQIKLNTEHAISYAATTNPDPAVQMRKARRLATAQYTANEIFVAQTKATPKNIHV